MLLKLLDRAGGKLLSGIVIAASNNDQISRGRLVDQSMFVVDPARPIAGEVCLERLRLPDTFEWRTKRIFDEEIGSSQEITVMLLKPEIVFPRGGRKAQFHGSTNSRSSTVPA